MNVPPRLGAAVAVGAGGTVGEGGTLVGATDELLDATDELLDETGALVAAGGFVGAGALVGSVVGAAHAATKTRMAINVIAKTIFFIFFSSSSFSNAELALSEFRPPQSIRS